MERGRGVGMCEGEGWGAWGCGGNGDAERQDGVCLRTLDGPRGQLKGRVRRPVTGGGPFPPVSAGALRLAGMCEGEGWGEQESAAFGSGAFAKSMRARGGMDGLCMPSALPDKQREPRFD